MIYIIKYSLAKFFIFYNTNYIYILFDKKFINIIFFLLNIFILKISLFHFS